MSYQEAQDCIVLAERRLQVDDIDGARRLYCRAAVLHREFVDSLDPDEAKARSIFGVSTAVLFFKAHELDMAEMVAHRLSTQAILDPARRELRELLQRIWEERQLQEQHAVLSRNGLVVRLLGGKIIGGKAPLDAIDAAVGSARMLLRRAAAMLNQVPFSSRAPDMRDIDERYAVVMPPAFASSYMVELYLKQEQLPLDLGIAALRSASPDDIISHAAEIIEQTACANATALQAAAPDGQYRTAMVRLVRSMLPDGESVGELQVRRTGDQKENAIRLVPGHKQGINNILRPPRPRAPGDGLVPDNAAGGTTERLVGILRAVDLDKHKLRVDSSAGPLAVPPEFDDTIGLFLNKEVIVTRHRPPNRQRWKVVDVEPYIDAVDSDLASGTLVVTS